LLDERTDEIVRVQFTEIESKKLARLYYGHHLVFVLAEADMNPLKNEALDHVGEQTKQQLAQLFRDHAAQQNLTRTLRRAAETTLTLAFFAIFWLFVACARNAIVNRVDARVHGSERTVKIFGYDIRTVVFAIAESICRIIALGLVIAVGYVSLTFALNRFPYTRPWSERLRELFMDSVTGLTRGAIDELPNLLSVLVIFFVTRGLARILTGWLNSIESGRGGGGWLDPEATRRLLVIGIWIFAATVAFPYLPGSHSEAFRGISVLVGLMVTIGGSGFVGQIIGGLAAIYSRSVRTGDYITIGEISGVVREVGMLSTKVVTRTREEVTIPNAMLISSAIRNHSSGPAGGVALTTTVTIGYDTPWRQV
jgi:small-conductance mechanosensitive channel